MGIVGARSLMDSDPAHFCAEFTWGCDVDERGRGRNNNKHNTLGLLIDAKSLLHHIAFDQTDVLYLSPAIINEQVQIHIHRLLRVVGRKGGVHVFFDGLAPREHLRTQIEQMGEQASSGERLAAQYAIMTGIDTNLGYTIDEKDPPSQLLHHLAEWAFVEAVDRLRKRFTSILHMHRASMGESEALINQWLIQNDGSYSRVAIVSDDTNLLIYDSCPGFVPPSTLIYEERNGEHCLRGRYYLRSKFLRLLAGDTTTIDSIVMTTVAAIAGCDYCTSSEQAEEIANMRRGIIASDLGGLQHYDKKKLNKVETLKTILLVIGHFRKFWASSWLHGLCKHFTASVHKAQIALNGLRAIHDVYIYSLQVASNSVLDLVPGMIEVRRLLQHGFFFCQPLVETFEDADSVNERRPSSGLVRYHFHIDQDYPLVPLPPFSTQIETWSSKFSAWQYPHLKQVRSRLYSYVRLLIYNGRAPTSIPPGSFWTSSVEPIVEEIVRMCTGKRCAVDRTHVTVPDHGMVSAMFSKDELLLDDDLAVDRAVVFCIFGLPYQLQKIREMGDRANGVLFLASMMLPYNLAFLLFLMATAPRELGNFAIHRPEYNSRTCTEVHQVLPLLSVACSHANLLVNTIVAFWPGKALSSHLVLPPICVSDTFKHDNALTIWEAVRGLDELEYMATQDLDSFTESEERIPRYIASCFISLRRLGPRDNYAWKKLMLSWQKEVTPLYISWWEIFNMEDIGFPIVIDKTS